MAHPNRELLPFVVQTDVGHYGVSAILAPRINRHLPLIESIGHTHIRKANDTHTCIDDRDMLLRGST